MMKKLIAMTLALAMLLGLSTAYAWNCPGCGGEMSGKFCTECGTKKPENICPTCGANYGDKAPNFCSECGTKLGAAQPAAEPTAAPAAEEQEASEAFLMYPAEDGRLTLIWAQSGAGPYEIRYLMKNHDTYEEDLADPNNLGEKVVTDEIGVTTISYMVPGQAYWISMYDSEGNGGCSAYVPEAAPKAFDAFSVTVECKEVVKVNGEETNPEAFDAQSLATAGEDVNGLYLAFWFDNTGEAYEAVVQVVMEGPGGVKWVSAATRTTFAANTKDGKGWKFTDLYDDMAPLTEQLGAVPAGEYTVSVYLNGMLAGSGAFQAEAAAAQAAAEEVALLLGDFVTNADGTMTASWSGGEAPYTVRYAVKRTEDYHADLSSDDSFGNWTTTTDCTETSYTLNKLVPGQSYWITVLDVTGNGRYKAYEPTTGGEALTGITATLEAIPRLRLGTNTSDLTCLPGQIAGKDDEMEHGAFLRLHYDNPGAGCTKLMQVVFTLPNGECFVDWSQTVDFDSGTEQWVGWNFYSMEWYLGKVRNAFDAIPVGDISVAVYLDGKLAATAALPVQNVAAMSLNGVEAQGNGTYSLSWKGGKAPYTVYYYESYSDDMLADRQAENYILWRDATDTDETTNLFEYLVPGKTYWLGVIDSAGQAQFVKYAVPTAGNSGLNMTVTANPRKAEDGVYTDMAGFSAASLNADYTCSYGLYLSLYYDKLPADTQRQTQFVITLPNGVSFCTDAFAMNMYAGGDTYWDCFTLDWPFGRAKAWYDEVPQGDYRLDVYVEGQYGGGVNFYVGQ